MPETLPHFLLDNEPNEVAAQKNAEGKQSEWEMVFVARTVDGYAWRVMYARPLTEDARAIYDKALAPYVGA